MNVTVNITQTNDNGSDKVETAMKAGRVLMHLLRSLGLTRWKSGMILSGLIALLVWIARRFRVLRLIRGG